MTRFVCLSLLVFFFLGCSKGDSQKEGSTSGYKYLSVEEYQDAVYASWIGQIIGNTYGLGYEFTFIEEPGPDDFPYGYSSGILDEVEKYNGAFSDDDTDIEYMYLTEMEEYGIEPTYYQLAEAWKEHVERRVWCANRAALALMHAGHYPPVTGMKEFNAKWCQIDPQLVNEIWAVTAPGMIDYAVDKSEFMARITSDSFGIEPTLHYAAMYSAAFFEKNIHKLIDTGNQVLPDDSRFKGIVQHVKELHTRYPNNWQKARKIVKDQYLVKSEYNRHAWPPIDANLNGALGIMALLYGEGNFQKTLDYACAFGMDADNQAATMCGLLGIVHGLDSIPRELMFPLEDASWDKPFNDHYAMITRENMEDAKLTGMAERIAQQGERLILARGGERVERNGKKYYKINSRAHFEAAFELNPIPHLFTEVGQPFFYPLYTGKSQGDIQIEIKGEMPPGIECTGDQLTGQSTQPGRYQFEIVGRQGDQKKDITVHITVHSENLSASATEILYHGDTAQRQLEILRDGTAKESFFSKNYGRREEEHFYGYRWAEPVQIGALSFNNGEHIEQCGWFTSFDVEYLKDGMWTRMDSIRLTPKMNLDNAQWLQPTLMDYHMTFSPVHTKGIRIIGKPGGVPQNGGDGSIQRKNCTSLAELRVYGE